MILDTIALLVLAATAVAGLIILRDRLNRARLNMAPVCANCVTPAAALVDFTCPGCGMDVRERGLSIPSERSPLAIFWRGVTLTIVVVLVGVIASLLLPVVAPPVTKSTLAATISAGNVANAFEQMDMSGSIRRYREQTAGTIQLQLVLNDGTTSLAQIDAATRRVDVSAPDGTRTTRDYQRDWARRWVVDAGVNAITWDASSEAMIASIDQILDGRDTRWGGTSVQEPPHWITPAVVIGCCVLWVIDLLLLTRHLPREDQA